MSEQNDGNGPAEERRDFLKGAAVMAGGAAAALVAADGSAAEAPAAAPGRTVQLALKPGIEAKAVHAALDRVFELAGCVACGLNGILDLRLNVVNPAINERFSKQGILGVSENLRGF
jgi:hypothetical protein